MPRVASPSVFLLGNEFDCDRSDAARTTWLSRARNRHASFSSMQRADAAQVAEHECAWRRAHEALSRLARQRAQADAEEGRWLLVARRSAAHVHLGFGSFGEYIERLLGYTGRSLQEKLRVAEALEELPSLARALETGALGWSAVRELTRVAVADTEQQWLDLAQGKTVRQLEELVAGKRPGDGPDAAMLPAAKRHVLRFEVEPETFALFREAITWLRRRSGDALDDDSALLSMARHVLDGPTDEGRVSYQIALRVCPTCGGGESSTRAESSWPSRPRSSRWPSATASTWVGCPRSPRTRTRSETARPRSKAPPASASGSHGKPTWAPVRSKRYRPRYAAQCCCATSTAAGCQVAETQRFSISTMSSCAPRVVAMSSQTSLLRARPITERPIAASSSSN